MTAKPQVQDDYLNEMRTSKQPVEVVLLGGRVLKGMIVAFDTFTIRLRCKRDDILIFKSAVAVVGPIPKSSRRKHTNSQST